MVASRCVASALLAVVVLLIAGADAARLPPSRRVGRLGRDGTFLTGSGQGLDFLSNLRVLPGEANATDLDRYMALPTPDYNWEYNASLAYEGSIPLVGKYTAYFLNMTSHRWLTDEEAGPCGLWQHAVMVVVPHNLDKSVDTAMVWPTLGNDPPGVPGDTEGDMVLVTTLAVSARQVVVAVFQTPNQECTFPQDPKHTANRSEDSLIAYTWRRYLDLMHEGDTDGRAFRWPSHVPMTMAVVRTMDATQEFLSKCDECGLKDAVPQAFIPFGASKRGWVSWMTAAVDKRVCAIAPVVMDLLHMSKGFHMWWRNYGGLSFIARDYWNEDLLKWLDTPEMDAFFSFEDPIVYKDRYTELPKLVITSTGDEFFQVMDDHLWFDEMPGNNHLLRAPNADHLEVTGISKIVPSLVTWVHTINLQRKAKAPEPVLPALTWQMWSEGEGVDQVAHINATLDLTKGWTTRPKSVHLRHATTDPNSGRLDFRWFNLDPNCALPRLWFYGSSVCPIQLVWFDDLIDPVEDSGGVLKYHASMGAPQQGGWQGFYIQFEFPGHEDIIFNLYELTFTTNTQVAIVPDTQPFPGCQGEACQGQLV
ncbi:PhoPQ-activated pathogenicity-related protein [Chloropicon roscoffensis]|uniref:PhoPQ-activated pathogenicity-related protein n=1 Tax=Chloropicon roscoffensis TaxID=1461544 RepID=A0AAX4PG92_9CHLO